ncbi:MAG: penicillin-binding protein [Deltaproteobacteria bacterium]|nr:penicillin-binding protein [Deltaproteobacteria bacterium]
MSNPTKRAAAVVLVSLGLAASAIAFAAAGDDPPTIGINSTSRAPSSRKVARGGTVAADVINGFDPRNYRCEGNFFVSDLKCENRAVLSLDAGLQSRLEGLFERFRVPYGAAVAIEPKTGRILSYVSWSSVEQNAGDIALDATAPAASVFKIVTAAALVDARVSPEQRLCYQGGFRHLTLSDLVDDPRRDAYCASFEEAMGSSLNSVFAKLADRHLSTRTIERYASAFGFGHALPFDIRPPVSRAEIPGERLEFARTAAGFWHTYMSPLHGALIASTIANDGAMPWVSMIDRVIDKSDRVVHRFQPRTFRQVVSRNTARIVGKMMQRTVTHGTARQAFYDSNGRAFLPGIAIAGKTGSLTQPKPYRAYSWWVGYAPLDQPAIALAILVVNTPRWRIKASYAAREALRYYLVEKK